MTFVDEREDPYPRPRFDRSQPYRRQDLPAPPARGHNPKAEHRMPSIAVVEDQICWLFSGLKERYLNAVEMNYIYRERFGRGFDEIFPSASWWENIADMRCFPTCYLQGYKDSPQNLLLFNPTDNFEPSSNINMLSERLVGIIFLARPGNIHFTNIQQIYSLAFKVPLEDVTQKLAGLTANNFLLGFHHPDVIVDQTKSVCKYIGRGGVSDLTASNARQQRKHNRQKTVTLPVSMLHNVLALFPSYDDPIYNILSASELADRYESRYRESLIEYLISIKTARDGTYPAEQWWRTLYHTDGLNSFILLGNTNLPDFILLCKPQNLFAVGSSSSSSSGSGMPPPPSLAVRTMRDFEERLLLILTVFYPVAADTEVINRLHTVVYGEDLSILCQQITNHDLDGYFTSCPVNDRLIEWKKHEQSHVRCRLKHRPTSPLRLLALKAEKAREREQQINRNKSKKQQKLPREDRREEYREERRWAHEQPRRDMPRMGESYDRLQRDISRDMPSGYNPNWKDEIAPPAHYQGQTYHHDGERHAYQQPFEPNHQEEDEYEQRNHESDEDEDYFNVDDATQVLHDDNVSVEEDEEGEQDDEEKDDQEETGFVSYMFDYAKDDRKRTHSAAFDGGHTKNESAQSPRKKFTQHEHDANDHKEEDGLMLDIFETITTNESNQVEKGQEGSEEDDILDIFEISEAKDILSVKLC